MNIIFGGTKDRFLPPAAQTVLEMSRGRKDVFMALPGGASLARLDKLKAYPTNLRCLHLWGML